MAEGFVDWSVNAISRYLVDLGYRRIFIECFVGDSVESTGGDDFYHNLEFYVKLNKSIAPLEYLKEGKLEKGKFIRTYVIYEERKSWAYEKAVEIIQVLKENYLKIDRKFILFDDAYKIIGPIKYSNSLYSFKINLK
jgi:hypothetical protein